MNAPVFELPPPLTWLDVERQFKLSTALWSRLPHGVLGIDCFSDGMEIRHSAESNQLDDWLARLFGHAYRREPRSIRLRIGPTDYPVDLVRDDDSGPGFEGRTYPLWQDMTYVPTGEDEQTDPHPIIDTNMPPAWQTEPPLVSFHSFKGGVGRTTALMTYVAACLQIPDDNTRKILVVDADLEAPGISFWLDEVNRPSVSFVQLLEALHYPPSDVETSLDFFAGELHKTSLSVAGMQRELFVLPAALDLAEIQDMPVSPAHLARDPENPWQLSDHLHELGRRLDVDAVFIDLRAGLSELASPLLFDPRVDHFFVTTVASQSVLGTREILRRLYAVNRRLPRARQDAARPTVLINMLTKELRESHHYETALSTLNDAYPPDPDDALSIGIQWLEAEFLNPLMAIGSVRKALEIVTQSTRLFARASEWAEELFSTAEEGTAESDEVRSSQGLARELHRVCEQALFAESDADLAILAIEPLLNLGKHYSKDVPNLLMIGAKGAGKTFTYRALVRSRSWSAFLNELGFAAETIIDAAVFPVLWSSNIQDTPGGEIKTAQKDALDSIKTAHDGLLRQSELGKQIRDALTNPPASWEDFWDGLIARQTGFPEQSLDCLNGACVERGKRIAFVFDGIEDAFEDASDETAAAAIHALLRLPDRISELENRHIGSVVFIRADYVKAAVRQNVAQLFQRYQPFRLHWDAESFLRLAYMLSCKARAIRDGCAGNDVLRVGLLKEKLEQLWGKKLGSEKSKESHSARWVYAVLCDLNGNLQARDLVRFLKFAAGLESDRTDQTWSDRVLSPESMRKAIPQCSSEKVKEARQEFAPLRNWMSELEAQHVRNLEVPFSQDAAMLSTELIKDLEEIGVLYDRWKLNLVEAAGIEPASASPLPLVLHA
jgi:MinD-like ATPase involved in chromosome partitioning or flagellar assembly